MRSCTMPSFIHPSESFDKTEQTRARKRRAIIGSDPCWHPVLPHRCFANRSNLAEVHSCDDLAADQITTVRVGDGEWIATLTIASDEIPL